MAEKIIRVALKENGYPIYIGTHLLSTLGEKLKAQGVQKVFLITDANVYRHQGAIVEKSLKKARIPFVTLHNLPPGEAGKSLTSLQFIYEQLAHANVQRDTWILALGGGAIGDIAGFAAATYMRGIPFAQIPTTLLAQTDASIGGKTALNFEPSTVVTNRGEEARPFVKNLVGAFYQPRFVLIDLETLQTLPPRELRAGLAEVVKYGVIDSIRVERIPFFTFLEKNANALLKRTPSKNDMTLWQQVIAASCQVKANVVRKDERESNIRATLNFGHTVGHALEALLEPRLLHGEAIALGMVAESLMAQHMGLLKEEATTRLSNLLETLHLPTHLAALSYLTGKKEHVKVSDVLVKCQLDKKVKGGKVRFVLPIKLGKVVIRSDVPNSVVKRALLAIGCHE